MRIKHYRFIMLPAAMLCLFSACSEDNNEPINPQQQEAEAKYVGKAVGNFSAEEWYPGG